MTDKAKKTIILARVSDKEQEEGHSIEAQKYRLLEYCIKNNLEVLETFEFTESSSRGERKKFKEMLKFAKNQRETIAIIADKVDRTQRRISEIPLLEEPINAGKIELHFRTEGYILHKDSQSHEKLMWGINVLMAQSYIDNLSDNVKRSLEHKLRKGECIRAAPLGYLNTKDKNDNSTVIVDPVRGSLVKRIFEEYATGAFTLADMARRAKKLGLRTKKGLHVNKSTIHELIQNPFYYGIMTVKGVEYPHFYETLISKEIFMTCKDVRLGWNKKPFKYGGKDFLFRGLITCATTGKVVTAETKTKTYANGKTQTWTYLAAWNPNYPSKKVYVREDKIIKQVADVFAKIGIRDPEILKEVIEYLKQTNELKTRDHNKETAILKKEHSEIENKLDSLLNLRISNEITTEEFNAKKQQLKDRQYEITRLLQTYDNADDKFTETFEKLLNLSSRAYETFIGSEISEKRKMIKMVFQNLQLKGSKLSYSLRFPFDFFEKNGLSSRVAPRAGLEPATERLTAVCSTTELPGNMSIYWPFL